MIVQNKNPNRNKRNRSGFLLAEREGFEPSMRCRIPDFESGPL